MKNLFDDVSFKCSVLVTKSYSTSFSLAVKMLDPTIREAIYSIYGFVRFADEIVDSFHGYDKETLLVDFENEYTKHMLNDTNKQHKPDFTKSTAWFINRFVIHGKQRKAAKAFGEALA